MSLILQHLRRTLTLPNEAAMTDGELLDGFVASRDEAAFAALVRRHGPMVWGVCRRVIPSYHDAEDAFQATFLVLARRAASVMPREMVAPWLYGVAHQTARNARANAARRNTREKQLPRLPESPVPENQPRSDLQPILDQELSRLPPKYRAAILLCDLEGRTRKDVAQQFNVPEGTLSGWLTRGRAMLARRLTRRGLELSGAAVAAALSQSVSSAAVPAAVLAATLDTVHLAAARGAVTAGAAALAEGQIRSVFLAKLKIAAGLLLMLSAAGMGTAALVYRVSTDEPPARAERNQGASTPKPEPGRTAATPGRGTRKITIGAKTTYVEGPLDQDGCIDYETALNERLSKDITPQNNANALLWSALGPRPEGRKVLPEFFERLQVPAPPERGNYFVGLTQYANVILGLAPGQPTNELLRQRNQASKRPWVRKDSPPFFAWLKANEKPLEVVVEATQRSHFYYPMVSNKEGDEGWYGLVGAMLPGVHVCKEIAAALTTRAMLHAGEGRFDQAWQDLLACHRLGRLLARQGDPTVYRIGMAIDQAAADADLALLGQAQPTAKQARSWLRDLQSLPPLPPVADWFDLGGRFLFLDSVMHTRRHGVRFLRVLVAIDPRNRGKPPVVNREAGPDLGDALAWDSLLQTGNTWFDRMAAVHRIPDRAEREKEFDRIEKEVQTREKESGSLADVIATLQGKKASVKEASKRLGDALVGFYLQEDLRRVRKAADRAEQRQRNLHLAFALAAYRGDHGRYPKELAALAPAYLKAIPDDLFSGRALVYRPSRDGYLLYSTGVNGRDEGGRGPDDVPPGDDLNVRMTPPEPERK